MKPLPMITKMLTKFLFAIKIQYTTLSKMIIIKKSYA